MAEKLEFLDEHYLSAFEKLEIDSSIPMQPAFEKKRDLTMEYPISESENSEGNSYLAYSTVVGEATDTLTAVAFEVLDYALLSAPGAPLKTALLDDGIGMDVYGSYDDGIRQPYFDVIAKGTTRTKRTDFLKSFKAHLPIL